MNDAKKISQDPGHAAIAVTFFDSMYPKTKREGTLDLETLGEEIGRAHAPSKEELPWVKLARFGNTPNSKGYLRYNENVVAISGVELDCDGETISIDAAVEIAEKAGLRCLIYSSPSHTPDKPRWRLLAPFESELDPIQRDHMAGRIAGLFNGIFAGESWTLSQSYFYGFVDGNEANHRVEVVDGMTVDNLHELDRTWRPKPLHEARFNDAAGAPDAAYRRHAYQQGRFDYDKAAEAIRGAQNFHNALLSLAAHLAGKGRPREQVLAEILEILDQVPAHLRDDRYKARASPRHLNGILNWVFDKEAQKVARSAAEGHAEERPYYQNRPVIRPPQKYIDAVQARVQRLHLAASNDGSRVGTPRPAPRPSPSPVVLTERQMLNLATPPDWVVKRILERGYLYTMTGAIAAGKTNVALLLTYMVGHIDGLMPNVLDAAGRYSVKRGRVVFLADENPTDVARRMQAIRLSYSIKGEANAAFVGGVFSIEQHRDAVAEQIKRHGPADLLVVDTAAAYFQGLDENSNVEAGAYARMLRSLSRMPGNPTVLVLTHPRASARERDEMTPRGGSAFLGEIDGNLVLMRNEDMLELSHGKMRGPNFDPIAIELRTVTHQTLRDTDGDPTPYPVCFLPDAAMVQSKRDQGQKNRNGILAALLRAYPKGMTQAAIAEVTKVPQSSTSRWLGRLKTAGLIENHTFGEEVWRLTPKGKKAAETVS
jgi:predicted transcriptional regulator